MSDPKVVFDDPAEIRSYIDGERDIDALRAHAHDLLDDLVAVYAQVDTAYERLDELTDFTPRSPASAPGEAE